MLLRPVRIEIEEDSCMRGDQAPGLHCVFHHDFILVEVV